MFPLGTFPDDAQAHQRTEKSDETPPGGSISERVDSEPAEAPPEVRTPQQRSSSPDPHSLADDREAATPPVSAHNEHWHGPTVVSNPLFVRSFKRRIRTRERRGCRYKTLSSTADLRPPDAERKQQLEATEGNEGTADDDWEEDETYVGGRVMDAPLLEEHDESDTYDLGSPGSDSVFLPHRSPSTAHSPSLSPSKQECKTDFLGKWRSSPLSVTDSPGQESRHDLSEGRQELKERNTGLSFLSRLGKSVSPKKKHFRPPSKSGGETGLESVTDVPTGSGGEAAPTSPRSGLPVSTEHAVRLTKIPVRTTYVVSPNKDPQPPGPARSPTEGVVAGAHAAEGQIGRYSSIPPTPRLPPPPPSRKYGVAPNTIVHARDQETGSNRPKDSITRVQPGDSHMFWTNGSPGVAERPNETLDHKRVTASCPHLYKEMASSPRELQNVEETESLEGLSPKRGPHSAPCALGPGQALLPDSTLSAEAMPPESSNSGRTGDVSPRKNKFFPGFVFLGDGTVKKSETERGGSRERGRKERSGTSEWKVTEALATLSQGRLKRAGALKKKEDLHRLIADVDPSHAQGGTAGKPQESHEGVDASLATGGTPHARPTARNSEGNKTNVQQDTEEVKSYPEKSRAEAVFPESAPRQLSERYVKNRAKRTMERSISVPFWTKFQSQDVTSTVTQSVTDGGVVALQSLNGEEISAKVKSQGSEEKIEHVALAAQGREQRRASHKRARSQDATRSFSAEALSLAPSKSSSHENINKRDKSELSGLAMDLLTSEGEIIDAPSPGGLELTVPQRHTSCIDVVLAGRNEQEPSGFSRVLWDSKLRSVSAACLTKKGSGGKGSQITKWFDGDETTRVDQVDSGGSPKTSQHLYTSPYEILTQPRERPYLQRLMGVFTMLGAVSHASRHEKLPTLPWAGGLREGSWGHRLIVI